MSEFPWSLFLVIFKVVLSISPPTWEKFQIRNRKESGKKLENLYQKRDYRLITDPEKNYRQGSSFRKL